MSDIHTRVSIDINKTVLKACKDIVRDAKCEGLACKKCPFCVTVSKTPYFWICLKKAIDNTSKEM